MPNCWSVGDFQDSFYLLIFLQEHPFLVEDRTRTVDMSGWVARALEHQDPAQPPVSEPNL